MNYNQNERAQSVRIGNWYEELMLKAETGVRYNPDPKNRANALMTTGRCITHTEKLDAKDYKSVTREQIIDPTTHPEYKWQKMMSSGPRRQLIETQLKAKVASEFEKRQADESRESLIVDYTSEAKINFSRRGFTPKLDETHVESRIPINPAQYMTDTAISFYSDSIKNGGSIGFPATSVVTSNPFRRNGAFTVDVRKDPLSRRSESNERPMPLPGVKQHREVNAFRKRLIEQIRLANESIPGKSVRDVIRTLWLSPDENTTGLIHINRLSQIFDDYFAFVVSNDEKYALLCTFDAGIEGYLLLVEFSNFIRRIGNARRIDLINGAFSTICTDPEILTTTEGTIRERFLRSDVDELLRDLTDIHNYSRSLTPASPKSRRTPASGYRHSDFTIDDFFDYYIDLSAEVDDEREFESILRSSWGF